MLKHLSFLSTDLFLNQIPSTNTTLFFLLIVLMFVLVAVICEMDHQFILTFNIYLIIRVDRETEVAWMEQHDTGVTIDKHITANVELSSPKEERPDVVLDQSIMLEILISFFLLFLLSFFEDVGLVLEHIVERELP